ncbi:MAG: beta-propeller domain-containing protein, partial [Candidatus Nealsonbacteria bacterium]|nr:beta-propeller domain-containing protein [Candidatus Nealsonbacteria bacterium]
MRESLLRMRRVRSSGSRRRRLLLEPLEHRLLLDVGAAELADDRFEVRQNSDAQIFDVLANDTFLPDYQDERQITSVSYGSEGGRIEIADDGGSIRYAPPADFSGTEGFVYYVDSQFSAGVTVTVLPLLAADEYQFPPDGQTKVLNVLANDPFWPGYDGPGEITSTSSALLWGEVEIAADGKSLTYTPPMDVYGKDAFVYIVDDLYPAEVQIDILNPLEPDEYPNVVQRSENNVLGVTANDGFWPGYPGDRTITHVIGLTNGAAVTVADGGKTLLYTPAPDFAGRDHFRYVVDGVYETSVSVQVYRPVQDDSFEVDTNTTGYPLTVTGNDTYRYWNGNAWVTRDVIDRVTSVGETAHGGTVAIMPGGQGILYSAPAGFEGTDTFEYVADGKHPASVQIYVTPPVRDDSIGSGVYEDTVDNVLNVLQNDFKGNGYWGPKVITSVSETSEGGIVTIATGGQSLVYTPPAGFQGPDTFSYEVDDALLAEVRVNVGPIATSNSYRFYPNPAQTGYALHVLGNDHFGSNYPGPGLITAVGETLNGGLVTIAADRKSLRFVPNEGGYDRFTYTVDGKYEASVTVSFDNFLRSDSFVVDQNSGENELDPLQNDFGYSYADDYAGPRLITSVGPAEAGGTVTIAADRQSLVYAPVPDFVGTDRFTYTVDGLMKSTIDVQVIRRVRDDVYRVEPDTIGNALPVLVNDLFGADYTGAGRITAVTETVAGAAAAVSEDGKSIEYTPPAGFTGEDTFTYTVDGALKAEVTVWAAASVEDVLPQFDSLADFEQSLLDDAIERYEHLFGKETGPIVPMDPRYDWFAGPEVAGDSRNHSETNVQVAGVDETDIIETDGDFLYILTDNELIIATAWPAQQMAIASRVTIEGEPIGEYLHSAAGSEGRCA